MGFQNVTIGNFGECKYNFPKEENATESLPYCDSDLNILKRVNETEQIKTEITDMTNKKLELEFLKDRGEITPEQEEELKKVKIIANTYSNVMSMKPYFINETTGDIHSKALRKLGDEAIDKSPKTKEILEGEYRVCDIKEKEAFLKEEKGELFNEKLYEFLINQDNKAVKFLMNFGLGNNEQRVYVYPNPNLQNVLIINRVGRTKLHETIVRDIQELNEINKMKELLESITLQANNLNKGKIAGSLDD